jgi:lipoprotein-anchoring transpeptidase ErfK/SrfK
MSSTDRQNRLLVAEDWKRIYQSYRNADFKSYDFDNLRRTMINYIRQNYPEDFNDYIESSEYLALIDLIAFLGQNIAFRTDLNARENFLELAERRESVLRLARLLSYNPKRNQAANGLLKVESVNTTESVRDSNNLNLENQTIVWNDPSNPNWQEQFTKILNAALPVNNSVGRPSKKDTVAGIPTEQYRLNSANTDLPVYGFNKTISGSTSKFEIVSTDVEAGQIKEEAPFPGNNFAFLYRDDGKGPASSNTGYFCHFRQGAMDQGTFTVDNPSTNQVVAIDAANINHTDVWLYKVDNYGLEEELWSKVDAVEGNNVIYNSLSKSIRNIYSVLTRANDRISLIFSDGTFGNLPQGNFRVYYRTSKNQRLVIEPSDMRGVSIKVPYISKTGKSEQLTMVFRLKYTVDNASTSESSESIKRNAPATYYTQNRMITAEDYQIAPLSISQEIIKVKSVNRTASGISRYLDLVDATGKYSKTNLFGIDGIITKEFLTPKSKFSFVTKTDIEGAIANIIEPILKDKKVKNYYYNSFPKILVGDLGVTWVSQSLSTNQNTGYFINSSGVRSQLGTFTASTLKLLKPGTLVKIQAPSGKYFQSLNDNELVTGTADVAGAVTYKWTKIVSVVGDGTVTNADGTGPVILNDTIPSGSKLVQVIPRLATELQSSVALQLIDQVFAYNSFGLRFDVNIGEWRLISTNNLNVDSPFSIGKTGDSSNLQLDSSWLLLFETNGETYTITYRGSRYVFESAEEIRFYFDSSDKIYNNRTGKIIKDKISVLNINKQPDSTSPFTVDYDWEIVEEYRDAEGYVDSSKIQVSFFDEDDDGVVDNPELFDDIVNETANALKKYVFQLKTTTIDGVEEFSYISTATPTALGKYVFTNGTGSIQVIANKSLLSSTSIYDNGQIFYFIAEDLFQVLDKTTGNLTTTQSYRAKIGRDKLKFHYVHAADESTRIDPSVSNIIDVYLLTKSYDDNFRLYIDGTTSTKPLSPSSDELYLNYGQQLNTIKSISDEIIYHPVKYKILFGENASSDLQAKFKIVKNSDLVINDNEVKTRVIAAINEFFALENWEFGETFYFTELSTYVMQQLSPNLVTFVIVPNQATSTFGSLFEIKAEADEVFISGATVADIELIDSVTATRLRSSGSIVTDATTVNTGLTSSGLSTTGGTSY